MSDTNPESRIAVYTGSFDPITLGHLHIIDRASRLFDSLVIGIGINADKRSLFTPDQRRDLVCKVTRDLPTVQVQFFDGLAVDFVRSLGSRTMVRGIRPLTDIAGEFTMMMANRQLDEEIETVFLMAYVRFSHFCCSSLKLIASVREIYELLEMFVPG